ncbi:NADH-quinone oxidoreductase subunit NuoK [Natronomonas sp.]|uniref:NADH-quinone oxidoreductase subunit NuoK n=1 Tax=Natronomonas sp. TaxID=2184060 RepID=UPI0026262455|nr:NADH-quinone oxidoreductase subunit NuoK [Natronomonas sp.]
MVLETVPAEYYLLLSAAVFCIGLFGVLTRRNAMLFLMSVELLLNAANINLVAFAFYWGEVTGQTFVLFTMALAAAEVAVGIGIILVLYRNFDDVDVTEATTLRW